MNNKKKRELLPSYIDSHCKCGYEFKDLFKYQFLKKPTSYVRCPICKTINHIDTYVRYYVYEVNPDNVIFSRIADVSEIESEE